MVISYDGSDFCGYQRQKNCRTVQEELERALSKLLCTQVSVVGSSRTDAGVHALGQVVHFDVDGFPVERIKDALNSLLPEDVKVVSAKKVKSDFNARFDVQKKTYNYVVTSSLNPPFRKQMTYVSYPLDEDKMLECLELFKGKHNFKGFCSSAAQVKSFEREIMISQVKKRGDKFIFTFTANGFMQHMVRILVGTAIDVGRGKLSLDSVKEALETGERKKAGKTMPPQGLYLKRIYYKQR